MMVVTIYTKESCSRCERTKSLFSKAGIVPIEIPISDPEISADLAERGYTSTPVVTVELPHYVDEWEGLQVLNINSAIAAHKGEE